MGRKKLDRERIHVSLPRGMPDELDKAAQARGWDRSRLIEELAAAYLTRRAKRKAKKPPV